MRRREFITLLGGAAAAWPTVARGQQAARRPLVAVLSVPERTSYEHILGGLALGLRELGYQEGRNIDLVERYADGDLARLPALAKELIGLKPDVIIATASSAALAAKKLSPIIPIVVGLMADSIRLGLIASEARPGGNVTGILVNLDGLPGKQLQFAAELKPGTTKVGFLLNVANPGMVFQRPEIEAAASTLSVTLVTAAVRSPDDLAAAVMVGQDGMFNSEKRRIGRLAADVRLPWVSGRDLADAGAVIGYGVNLRENFRRAATYVDKIIKGAKPADLPVELPTKVEMVVNLKSAKVLGLTISPELLGHADEVIE